MQKWIKSSFVCLMVIVLLSSGTVSAATKNEQQFTDSLKNYSFGMTVTEFAKQMYGKSYQKYLTKKNGSTVLKHDVKKVISEESVDSLQYFFYDQTKQEPMHVMQIMFKKKPKDKLYRLVFKGVDMKRDHPMTVRQSTKQLMTGKQIRFDMTTKQVDAVLTGKGLGAFGTLGQIDTTSVLRKKEVKAGEATIIHTKSYVFSTATNQWQYIFFIYDVKKKTYIVESYETF
ncbi:hypothetical protein [Exiguobacterium acetylicum]|uniref:hypothetical protein n=1 Tax=Exiguobacterium acetylicum TaxID=41170 RepID=UPI000681484F|nr:hypothetical protein [Exiguobacterium acetylicum]KNH34774.1 hypothetical protein ACS74_09745 [Exiguobacterium acetylicum]